MIAVIDYDRETIDPVKDALDRLDTDYIVTNSELKICRADKVIFPSSREVSYAIRQLHMLNLFTILRIIKRPVLGIDSGMQLLAKKFEPSNLPFLGVFSGTIEKFDGEISIIPNEQLLKVKQKKDSILFNGIDDNQEFYFDHSHYLPEVENTTSTAVNGIEFTTSMEKRNYYGVQFLPELSGDAGLKVLKNFIDLS